MIEALSRAGITLRTFRIGQHRAQCPKCNKGPRDNALAVRVDGNSAVWKCHRCDWSGHASLGTKHKSKVSLTLHQEEQKSTTLSLEYRRLWRECQPVTVESIAGRYLIGRCCSLPCNDVRWHRAIWHPMERREIPAIVALVTDSVSAEAISLHFTFLARDGSGKAAIQRPRLYLARHRKQGGVVRLHADEDVTAGLVICEGLENGLTYALEYAPVWCCLDAGNLAKFPVLPSGWCHGRPRPTRTF